MNCGPHTRLRGGDENLTPEPGVANDSFQDREPLDQ